MANFNLEILNSADKQSIPFLPFGVTSIEFTVSGDCEGWLRTKKTGLFKKPKKLAGFADGNENLLVVWGGGRKNENGVKMENGIQDRMFMQVIDLNNEVTDQTQITLKHTFHGEQQTLRLTKPVSIPTEARIVKMTPSPEAWEGKVITGLEGEWLPEYYSRWFPPKTVQYKKILAIPKIRFEYTKKDNKISSPIDIYMKSPAESDPDVKVCEIRGDIRRSTLHAELFSLIEERKIFVLRFWLYWLEEIESGRFLDASEEEMSIEEQKNLGIEGHITEVPDIERFDFVIDAKSNKIIWYGTDFHYQERWGRVDNPPVKARIAGGIDLVTETIGKFPLRAFQPKDYFYDPQEVLKATIVKEDMDKEDERKAKAEKQEKLRQQGLDQESERDHLGINILNHVPYIEWGWFAGMEFLSSDCRNREPEKL